MSEQTQDLPDDDPTNVDPDDPSQQSAERDRVEAERKLSSPEEAEGGERGKEGEEEQPSTLSEEDQKVQQEREQQATEQQQGQGRTSRSKGKE